ncbi:acetyltransferase [Lederbergia lenta]|uniref:acetyltransferase n=1 Tax=Lederbergia lenta TaxID=1467 RepID=UPI0020426A8B|nr:acetyltransferase [Lederbergia lenta]MCM3111975.1 acetyltransferase [Lederbergia lenta]
MKQIAIIGEGGHSKVIQDMILVCGEYQIIAILDDKNTKVVQKNEVIIGPLSHAEVLIKNTEILFVIAIGNNLVRQRIAGQLISMGAKFATIIHPTSVISPSASIGVGVIVMANSVINADTVIGNHVIINTSAVVEHDNHIGDFAHISPRSVLTGNVRVGEGTQIGAGSVVIPGKQIGIWSIVGAGATVICNVPDRVTVAGVPAKVISK